MSGVCSIPLLALTVWARGLLLYVLHILCQLSVIHHTVVPPGVVLGGDLTKGDDTGGECSPGGMYQLMHIYSSSTLLMIWHMKHVCVKL